MSQRPRPTPDIFDALVLLGIASITGGLWLIFPPAALILVGVVLAAAGVLGSR